MIAEDVRRFAESPAAWGEIGPETGMTRVLTDRYCLLLGPVPSFTSVSRLRLEPDDVAETLAEIRSLVAEHGHREAIWWIGPSATPDDLVDRLRAHGLVPDERPSSEPHAASMVLAAEPPPAPAGIVVQRAETLDDFRLAGQIAAAAFEVPEQSAPTEQETAEEFARAQSGYSPRRYLAFADGAAAGAGRSVIDPACPAVLMIGGGVLAPYRGRGVYRALVRARWDDAVAAGTPALCTQAGTMSRPILERIGFQVVAEQEILLDPVTC